MMKPIKFRQGSRVNMNLLKLEIDRRFDVVTMMIKGMNVAPNNGSTKTSRKMENTYCQTQNKHLPLHQITALNFSNTPSMMSIKSPTNSKRSGLGKDKENEIIHGFSITSKSKKLNPIQESQNQALRTSRCKLQSQKKKVNKLNLNLQSSKKNHKLCAIRKKTTESNSMRDDESEVFTSFESARKVILTEKKNFFSSKNSKKFTTQLKPPVQFSVNSSIYDLSKQNSKLSIRKGSFNLNDSIVINSSSNINKKPNQSLLSSTNNNNTSSGFVSDYLIGDSFGNVPKRMIVSEDMRLNIQAQFESKFENLKRKGGKQPNINNIRIALLKRLEQKHQKTVEVTK